MKKKSRMFDYFKQFRALMAHQFSKYPIKMIQCDRGREFLSKAFIDFLHMTRIQQELIQSFNPHQNGVSKCKN